VHIGSVLLHGEMAASFKTLVEYDSRKAVNFLMLW
jgi:hypothetical protein